VEMLMEGRLFHSIIDTVNEDSEEMPRTRGKTGIFFLSSTEL